MALPHFIYPLVKIGLIDCLIELHLDITTGIYSIFLCFTDFE